MKQDGRHKVNRVLAATIITLLMIISCGKKETIVEVPVVVPADCPPSAPRGVYAVNLDEWVQICWYPNPEDDIAGYEVWRSTADNPNTFYYIADVMAETPDPWEYCFDDTFDVDNGEQHYYIILAFDTNNNVTDINDPAIDFEIVSATPRYEGYITLDEISVDEDESGFCVSNLLNEAVPYMDPSAEIYYRLASGIRQFAVYLPDVQIQDYGFISNDPYGFDIINYAPSEGWSPSGISEVILGHCYILRFGTGPLATDYNYGKIWIDDVTDTYVSFYWAYQTDAGNRDLCPGPVEPQDKKNRDLIELLPSGERGLHRGRRSNESSERSTASSRSFEVSGLEDFPVEQNTCL